MPTCNKTSALNLGNVHKHAEIKGFKYNDYEY